MSDALKSAFLVKEYCHAHLSGQNGGCKTCELSNYLIHDGAQGCAVNRPGLCTIKDKEARK